MSGEGEDSGEKSHAPTERRLEQARRRGDIPQSADVTTAAAWGGLVLAAVAMGGGSLAAFGGTLAGLLDRSAELSSDLFGARAAPVLAPWLARIAGDLAAWIAVPTACVVLALLAQRAPAFAPSKLAFKGSRISPLSNGRQKFGPGGLVEFLKALAKLSVMAALLGLYLSRNLPAIVASAALSPAIGLAGLLDLILGLMVRVAAVALAFALADLLWQHLSFQRRNRMTRRDMLDELKESEGDPALRQQRRARAVAIATSPLRKAVAEADVVIVNPTHYAVALAWDRMSGGAPRCVAKGVDGIAARIRDFAAEAGVPIHSDPPAARALFAEVAVGREIDRRHYRAVAAAIRFADRIRKEMPR